MEEIFYRRGKGRVTKSLAVYSDGQRLKLHYLAFDRTKITREQRMNGEKEQRVKTFDEVYEFDNAEAINPALLPHRELTEAFLIECFPHNEGKEA
ncbi:hypothetical protein BL250_12520 [Erwinia sp. OLTSP20]|uniref:hypothetical protein n=1 Tax=Enterobacterales TaxID=91347 RepID=UPI000C18209B|nr:MULTISPECIES: hypothetical protein [Enterobacterales]PII85126.1 hypothetical protein BMF91_23910 [Serratia sp. OLFL2]PIJ49350.1 hypothetical protein BV501_12995 [Erwinia sp. OAMSP11]PIJ69744.1 hypothetical protein BK416_13820 [Erwinia sp. OLSSP12]PIJ76228.1 hypothetical protein BLD47_18075 [Erwinia sp. OLCASP19]PIJ76749.1 hypothetical protein BLD46_18300 [Erwinia sp. OLMTSP26]